MLNVEICVFIKLSSKNVDAGQPDMLQDKEVSTPTVDITYSSMKH